MPDIQYFQGGYEEEKHDRALFGLLGGHDEIHIHFNANGGAPAKDVWESNNQVLGGLLAHNHDLHVHQDASRFGGPTDIKVHDGSVLGGLIIDDHKSDFKTQRMTAQGLETRESHESSGSSLGGIIGEGHNSTERTSVKGADGVTRSETKHESHGSILGGIVGASDVHSEMSQVTTPDGKTLNTHFKQDSSGEALLGLAAEGRSHTEYVDNGQGRIGIHTYNGSILGGVVYSGDNGRVFGADVPGAQAYLDIPTPYAKSAPAELPATASDYPPSRQLPPGEVAAPVPADAVVAPPPPGGDLSQEAPMGAARQRVENNFIDPDTHQQIPTANVLRFDNADYFLADGNNVRLYDSHNQRVNFVSDGSVAIAQGANGNDMVVDPVTHLEKPRLTAQVTADGKGVEFDFANGTSVKADANGDYQIKQPAPAPQDTAALEAAPPPVPPTLAPTTQPATQPVK